jgi:hypothetical protein
MKKRICLILAYRLRALGTARTIGSLVESVSARDGVAAVEGENPIDLRADVHDTALLNHAATTLR